MTPSEKAILDGLHAEMAAVPTTAGQMPGIKRLRRIRDAYIPPPRQMPGLGAGTEFGRLLDRVVTFHRDRLLGRPAWTEPAVPEADEEDPPEPEPAGTPLEADLAPAGMDEPGEAESQPTG